MKTFKFTAETIIEAENKEEAIAKFCENSSNFAYGADCDEINVAEEEDFCPECGLNSITKNSCGEIQCDNCGYSETE